VLAGVTHIARSPYLIGICLLLSFEALSATFAYLAQGTIVERSLDDRDQRATLLASIDLVANVVAAVIQISLTGRIVRRIGVGRTLALLPVVFLGGFACLGLSPTLTVLFATQVLLRAVTLALARPARESLFTVLPREDKYKAKNFIDTVVYRGGDAVGAALFALLTSHFLGLGLFGALLVALPVTIGWVAIALCLGRRQQRLAHASAWQADP
jgi:AAA family ATP:ADP antiporter